MPTTFGALSAQPILADVNGDGNLDLILSAFDATGASVYLGNGQGGFTYQTEYTGPPGDGVGFNMVADLNGDGIPDIAVLESDTLAIYLGEGGAKYATPFYIGTGSSPAGGFSWLTYTDRRPRPVCRTSWPGYHRLRGDAAQSDQVAMAYLLEGDGASGRGANRER